MSISLIVAYDNKTRAIGFKNELLFDIPDDLKRFRELTTGNAVIMGKETFISIGRPLPKRLNIILSRNEEYQKELESKYSTDILITASSIEEAVNKSKEMNKDIFIIGGSSIYKQAVNMDIVDNYYLTVILGVPEKTISKKEINDNDMPLITLYDKKIEATDYLPEFDLSIKKSPDINYTTSDIKADSFMVEMNLENYELKLLENKYHQGLHYINLNYTKNKQ